MVEVYVKKSDFIFILFISFIIGFSVASHLRRLGQIDAQSQTIIELEQQNQKQVQEILDSLNSIQNSINKIGKK